MRTQRQHPSSSSKPTLPSSYQPSPKHHHPPPPPQQAKSYQSVIRSELQNRQPSARASRFPDLTKQFQGWQVTKQVAPSSNYLANLSSNLLSYEMMHKQGTKVRYKTDEGARRRRKRKEDRERVGEEQITERALQTRRNILREAVARKESMGRVPQKVYTTIVQELMCPAQDLPTSRQRKMSSLFKKSPPKDCNDQYGVHLPGIHSNRQHQIVPTSKTQRLQAILKQTKRTIQQQGIDPFQDHLLFKIR